MPSSFGRLGAAKSKKKNSSGSNADWNFGKGAGRNPSADLSKAPPKYELKSPEKNSISNMSAVEKYRRAKGYETGMDHTKKSAREEAMRYEAASQLRSDYEATRERVRKRMAARNAAAKAPIRKGSPVNR